MHRILLLPSLLLAAALLGPSPAARAQFVDATVPPLDDPLGCVSVSWGDWDGDGDQDLFVGSKAANRLFRHDGTAWTDVADPVLQDTTEHARAAPWGDVDNDGDLDLYLCNKVANKLFRNDGGALIDVTVPPLDDPVSTRAAAWADYDADGDLDLYLANEAAPNRLFRNDAGTFVDVATGPLADSGAGSSVVWGDVDDDGDPDLYLCNAGSPSRLFRNEGGGAFTDATVPPLGNGSANGRGADMGDYDNDGDLDIYVSNGSQANKLFRNDGGGAWADATSGPLGDVQEGTGVAWADFDNDGDLDLYLVNWTAPNRLFRNDGGAFVDVAQAPLNDGGPGKGIGWCDVDEDGDFDLYLANSGQPNRLFRNDTSGSHWLHVEMTGTLSNRSAIGARVTAVVPGLRQVREVSGGSGVGSQGSLAVEFGLGSRVIVDSLIVRWPSGVEQVLTGVAADRRIDLTEALPTTGAPGLIVRGADGVRLLADPNPFLGATAIRFELPREGAIDLAVFDVRGRRVRHLESGRHGSGPGRVSWNGRDDTGRPLPAGVYLIRLKAGAGVAVRRIVLLR